MADTNTKSNRGDGCPGKRVNQLRNRQKHSARTTINEAIRNGSLKRQPCEKCGNPNAEIHHYTYADPYAIQWLCKKHHDHPRPHGLFELPVDLNPRKAGRPKGKWIPPIERIAENRRKFSVDNRLRSR